VLELEVPQSITFGTAVVRNDLDLAIDHVLLGGGVSVRLVRRLALGDRKTGVEQGKCVGSLGIEYIDRHVQVHRIPRTDRLAQTSQEESEGRELIGVQKFIDLICDLVEYQISGLKSRTVHSYLCC
jgi:hypothetical protein